MGGGDCLPSVKPFIAKELRFWLKFFKKCAVAFLKFKFYTIFTPNKINKIAKWSNKLTQRQKALKLSQRRLRFYLSCRKKSKIWLNCPEFKAKYLAQKHPNPPLLNPNDCDYTSIDADFAFECNLPLPPYYKLILISGSRCGHNALIDFFRQCGAKCAKDHLPKDLKVIYTSFYEFLVNETCKNDFAILPFVQYDYLDYTESEFIRYCNFFAHKVPVLVQVRDPFIKLLLVNNRWTKADALYHFTLNDDLPAILDRLHYMFGGSLEKAFEYLISLTALRQASAINSLSCIQSIDFIDTDNELMPNNAYETMKKLAIKYKLQQPQDRVFFEGLLEEDCFGLLPLTLEITSEDAYKYLGKSKADELSNHKVNIQITLYQYQADTLNFIDISDEILGCKWLLQGSDIRLYIEKDEYRHFTFLMKEAAMRYFSYFKEEFIKRVELEKAKRFSIEDILSALQKDKALSKKLQNLLNQELDCVKKMRPDIVKSWKYYQSFEKFMSKTKDLQ